MASPTDHQRTRMEIEVFYDGACPVCTREMKALRKLDRHHRIQFTDIAAPEFRPADHGRPMETFLAEIQARLPDGTWLSGIEVFRRLYTLLGFGVLVAPTRLPGISHLLAWGYKRFAANRLRLFGRCHEQGCEPT